MRIEKGNFFSINLWDRPIHAASTENESFRWQSEKAILMESETSSRSHRLQTTNSQSRDVDRHLLQRLDLCGRINGICLQCEDCPLFGVRYCMFYCTYLPSFRQFFQILNLITRKSTMPFTVILQFPADIKLFHICHTICDSEINIPCPSTKREQVIH